jgi:hypothetical protein
VALPDDHRRQVPVRLGLSHPDSQGVPHPSLRADRRSERDLGQVADPLRRGVAPAGVADWLEMEG